MVRTVVELVQFTPKAWERIRGDAERALRSGDAGEHLERLGLASWWLLDLATTLDARERAFGCYRHAGDDLGAGRVATWLAWDYLTFRGALPITEGWLARAHTVLDPLAVAPEHGWLAHREAEIALLVRRQPTQAHALATRMRAIGDQLGNIDLQLVALALQGLCEVTLGEWQTGMRRLDEASAAALGGEMTADTRWFGAVFCYLIAACERSRDHERAREWRARVVEMSMHPPLLAICRVKLSAVLLACGSWAEAELELEEACTVMTRHQMPAIAEARTRLAELRRRQGRGDEARALLDQCGPFPSAQLGFAALALDRNDFAGALEHVERYERRTAEEDELERALAAELRIRANLGLGRCDDAEDACARIEQVAARVPTDCWRASASAARGLVESSQGAHDRARRAFEDAIDDFTRAGARFEAALVRVELARCLDSLGASNAEAERVIADRVLAELGATAAKSLAGGPLSARELEVIAFVGKGLNNAEIAERLGLSEHTVKRHVANILNKLDVPTRAAAVARANELALL